MNISTSKEQMSLSRSINPAFLYYLFYIAKTVLVSFVTNCTIIITYSTYIKLCSLDLQR